MITRTAKRSLLNSCKRFSTGPNNSELESWIKIYERMQNEAALKAEAAVSSTKLDVAALRTEVMPMRSELSSVKNDVQNSPKGQIDFHKQINDIHRQIRNRTRLILAAVLGTAGTFFAANRYLDNANKNADTPKKPLQEVNLVSHSPNRLHANTEHNFR